MLTEHQDGGRRNADLLGLRVLCDALDPGEKILIGELVPGMTLVTGAESVAILPEGIYFLLSLA